MKFPEMPFRAASGSEHGRRTEKGSKGGHFVRWIIIKNSMLIRSSCARARALLFLRILEFPAFDSNIYQYITDLNGRKNPSKWEKKSVEMGEKIRRNGRKNPSTIWEFIYFSPISY
jgi:hypothetical protein